MYNYHINYCLDYSYDNEYGELVEDLVPCEDDISVVLTDDGYRIADGLTSLYSGQSGYWLN